MNNNTILSVTQKESFALLSIGTFLEYFDLMLYVHMAVLLNELFFPKTDPMTASVLAAFAFCSTYILRPLGALVFGYIGDKIGRKATIVISTTMMSISCLIMANLPTYAQIGITASVIVTGCRILQGLCTMGEVIGANIYLTEIAKPPMQYILVGFIAVIGVFGGFAALGIASFVTINIFDWRLAFWIGSVIALVGVFARLKMRETNEYVDAKKRVQKAIQDIKKDTEFLKTNPILKEKVHHSTAIFLMIIECSWPICFYFGYIHCGEILKQSFGFTAEQVIHNNFVLSIIQLIGWIITVCLSYKIYPIKILKAKFYIFISLVPIALYILGQNYSPIIILFIQSFFCIFGFMGTPAVPIFYRQLPVFKRFTYASFTYALSRALIYLITSFGLVYLTRCLGHWAILAIIIPLAPLYFMSLNYFEVRDLSNYDHIT